MGTPSSPEPVLESGRRSPKNLKCPHCGGSVPRPRDPVGGNRPGSRRRWVAWELAEPMWGKCTDKEIAEELKCSTITVSSHRRNFGIASSKEKLAKRFDWDTVDLTRPVAEIVKELGCSKPAVYFHRRKRGIRSTGTFPSKKGG